MSNPLLSFEHRITRGLAGATTARRWLIAVSGGVDSMVLAEVMRRWRGKYLDRLVVAHVHHGAGEASRDEAQAVVRAYARAHQLPFVTNRPAGDGPTDEAGLRRLRYQHLARWRRTYGLEVVALGHHRDDLLETRVHRLIRGTGPRGLTAMRPRRGARVRPLLAVGRVEIEAYARGRGLPWVEDPTNTATERNVRAFLRHAWLPQLEARLPGATRVLARSLDLLAEDYGTDVRPGAMAAACAGVRRAAFASLSPAARVRVVAEYVTALGLRDFGRSHAFEISKRLDTTRKEFTFRVCGAEFYVGAHLWWASRVCD